VAESAIAAQATEDTAKMEAPKVPMPAIFGVHVPASVASRLASWTGLAAVVTIAVIGVPLGVWLGTTRSRPGSGRRPQLAASIDPLPTHPSARSAFAEPAMRDRGITSAKPQVTYSVQVKATAPVPSSGPARSRVPATVVRQADSANRQVASVPAAAPVIEAPEPSPPPPVREQQVVAEPRVVARVPPAGRLFEPSDVDEAPRVATRVEPQLPGDLQEHPANDVAVVRMLISQDGHPFRITLLRRSKAGRPVDDAVVAAVTQWTFSPARKRGEAVSCWLNVGVPVVR
jgi:hypothetical protein